jgi:hypothetical protein
MSVDPLAAFEDGFDRLTTVSGGVVAILFVLLGLVELPVKQTFFAHVWDRLLDVPAVRLALRDRYGEVMVPENPLAMDVTLPVTVAAIAVLFVLVAAVRVLGIRTFSTPGSSSSREDATVGFPSALAAVVAFDALVLASTGVFLLGPGVAATVGGDVVGLVVLPAYLLVAVLLVAIPILLYVARQAIVLEGCGPIAALRRSYRLCRRDTVPIFLLLVALFGAAVVGGLGIGIFLPDDRVGPIVSTLYQRVVAVYGIAVSTQVYLQLQ